MQCLICNEVMDISHRLHWGINLGCAWLCGACYGQGDDVSGLEKLGEACFKGMNMAASCKKHMCHVEVVKVTDINCLSKTVEPKE